MTNTSQVYTQRYCDCIDCDECELVNRFYDLLGL